jgi:hypothetical protein
VILAVLFATPANAAETIDAYCNTSSGSDSCDRWYSAPSVTVVWDITPPTGEVDDGCTTGRVTQPGRVTRTCTVHWGGAPQTKTVWIGIDRTPPQVTGVRPARPPDHAGWFNHPVNLQFEGTDSVSGIASCSNVSYAGADAAGVLVDGSCSDLAGNVGTAALPLNYDATPPPPPDVVAAPRNRKVRLRWTATPDAGAVVTRARAGGATVVFRGEGSSFVDRGVRNERRYRYVVVLVDQAGNRSVDRVKVVPTASRLLTPTGRILQSDPPLLTWLRVRRAGYYNVQLFRGEQLVLNRWPRDNQLQLRRRLARGRYCWYVWPGFGPRPRRNYGQVLGKRCFTVTR